jgi:hypothetical protein
MLLYLYLLNFGYAFECYIVIQYRLMIIVIWYRLYLISYFSDPDAPAPAGGADNNDDDDDFSDSSDNQSDDSDDFDWQAWFYI